ncbi:hypothetical protein BSKO_01980 [Bryopsis sp. KO-2023]|nr:hypothetical protein BSKO_01980 [Bryopsis sp. KO-2023]
MAAKLQAKNEKQLKELARAPGNKKCAICTCMGTQYTCQPPSIFVCETCGGGIRTFPGFRIKSLTMATYSTDEVKAMKEGGNEKFANTYLAKWNSPAFPPPTDKNAKKIESFVRQVLVDKVFYDEGGAPKAPQSEPSRAPSTQGSETEARVSRTQSLSVSNPGWTAFDNFEKPTHAAAASMDQTGGPSSDSWADFTPAPQMPPPSRQSTGGSVTMFPPPPAQTSQPQGVGAMTLNVAGPTVQATNMSTPPGWNDFGSSDSFAQPAPANGATFPVMGDQSSAVGTPSTARSMNKPKAPVREELPADIFGPVIAAQPTNMPSFSPPSGNFMNQGAPMMVPAHPAPPQQAPVAGGGAGYLPQPNMNQGFMPNQPTPRGTQQPSFHAMHGIPAQQGMAPNQSFPGSNFSQSPDSSHLLSREEQGSDPTLFSGLVGDLRSTLPRARNLQGMGSMSFPANVAPAFGAQQFASFNANPQNTFQSQGFGGAPQQPQGGFGGNPNPQAGFGAPIQQGDGGFGGAMHANQTGFNGSSQPQSGFGAMQTSGFYPQGGQGYSGIQPGMVNQPQSGLQGGLQSSGNPFA